MVKHVSHPFINDKPLNIHFPLAACWFWRKTGYGFSFRNKQKNSSYRVVHSYLLDKWSVPLYDWLECVSRRKWGKSIDCFRIMRQIRFRDVVSNRAAVGFASTLRYLSNPVVLSSTHGPWPKTNFSETPKQQLKYSISSAARPRLVTWTDPVNVVNVSRNVAPVQPKTPRGGSAVRTIHSLKGHAREKSFWESQSGIYSLHNQFETTK